MLPQNRHESATKTPQKTPRIIINIRGGFVAISVAVLWQM